MNHLHLAVLKNLTPDADVQPVSNVELFNPNRYDFCWNDDYTAFRPIPLRWWDDASYARYQSGDED